MDNPIQPQKNLNPPVKKKDTYIAVINQGNINSIEQECQEVLNYSTRYNMDNIEDDIINFFKNYGSYQKKKYDIKIKDPHSSESVRKTVMLSTNPGLTEEEIAKQIMEMNSTPQLPETELLRDQLLIYEKITYLIGNKNTSNKVDPAYDYAYSIKNEKEKPFYNEFPGFLQDLNKHFKNPLPKDDLNKIDKVISNLSRILKPEDNIIKAYNDYLDSYRSYEKGQGNVKIDISFDSLLNEIYNHLLLQ